jgi:hypothetical protein
MAGRYFDFIALKVPSIRKKFIESMADEPLPDSPWLAKIRAQRALGVMPPLHDALLAVSTSDLMQYTKKLEFDDHG